MTIERLVSAADSRIGEQNGIDYAAILTAQAAAAEAFACAQDGAPD